MKRKVKNYIWVVRCEDATHLGGMMGTEYTIDKWRRSFTTRPKALAFIKKYLEQREDDLEPNYKDGQYWSWDIGSEIISVDREELL